MKKENFFTEEMYEANGQDSQYMLDVYIQMVLDEALYKRKKEQLLLEIDNALDQKNHHAFIGLSQEYKELTKIK